MCIELEDWGSYKNDYMWNPRPRYCECNKAFKVNEYLDIQNCSCEKDLINKLVLTCEDEVLNTTETTLDDDKATIEKYNCLIHTISLVIICLLLLLLLLQYSFQLAYTVGAKKQSANWNCPPFGNVFNIGLNFENKAFFYIYEV